MSRSRGPSFSSGSTGPEPQPRRSSMSRPPSAAAGGGGGLNPGRLRLKPLTPLDKNVTQTSPIMSPMPLSDDGRSSYTNAQSDRRGGRSHSIASQSAASYTSSSRYPPQRGTTGAKNIDMASSANVGSVNHSSVPHTSFGQRAPSRTASPEVTGRRSRSASVSVGNFDGAPQSVVRRDSSSSRRPPSNFADTYDDEACRAHARRPSMYARDAYAISRSASVTHPSVSESPSQPVPEALPQSHSSWVRRRAEGVLFTTKLLLGRYGHNEVSHREKALGQLLIALFGWRDAYAQIKNAISSTSLNTPGMAECVVLSHDVIGQLDHLFKYVLAEPKVDAYIKDRSHDIISLLNGVTPESSDHENAEPFQLSSFLKSISSDPAYTALFLDLLHNISQLFILVNPHLPLAYYSIKEVLSPKAAGLAESKSSSVTGNAEDAAAKIIQSLVAAFEQLTSSSIRPIVGSIVSWFEIADDALLDLAEEIVNFMDEPLNLPNPCDIIRHPMTGKLYSPQETFIRAEAIAQKSYMMMMEEPHKSALLKVLKYLQRALVGLDGNSEWTRFSRSAISLWKTLQCEESSAQDWAEAMNIILSSFVEVPLASLDLEDNSYSCSLSDLVITCDDILPEQVDFRSESQVRFRRPDKSKLATLNKNVLNLSGVVVSAKDVSFAYAKHGTFGIEDQGKADIKLTVNVSLSFLKDAVSGEKNWPSYLDSSVNVVDADVQFKETGKDKLYQSILWPLMKKSIVHTVESESNEWIKKYLGLIFPESDEKHVKKSRTPRRKITPASQLGARKSVSDASGGRPGKGSPFSLGQARDAFRRQVQQHPELRADVLAKLESPFSNVSSNLPSEIGDEDAGKKSRIRRKSMADYLTQEASKDATLQENITAPPCAVSQWDGARADDEAAFENMASCLSGTSRLDATKPEHMKYPIVDPNNAPTVHVHRGSDPRSRNLSMSGEISYDQYEQAIEDDDEEEQRRVAMARSLSEVATRDATTLEAIKAPPVAEKSEDTIFRSGEGDQDGASKDQRPSMSKMTRHLSGINDPAILEFQNQGLSGRSKSSPGYSAASQYQSSVPYQPRPRSMSVHSSLSQPADTGRWPHVRPARMSETLNKDASKDYTIPSAQTEMSVSSSRSSPSTDTGLSREALMARRKSFALDENASRDATLPENIASPGSSRPVSPLSANTGGFDRRRMARRTSSVSSTSIPSSTYTGMDRSEILPMGTTLTDEMQKDRTTPESQAEYARGKYGRGIEEVLEAADQSGRGAGAPGLSRDAVRKRSMSSFLSDNSKADATLYRNIASPPPADQKEKEEEEKSEPRRNPLQRRPSTVVSD